MHILLIHQAFAGPNDPGGTRHFEFARELVKAGHSVTVITSQANYLARSSGARSAASESIDGISIERLATGATSPTGTAGKRISAQLGFARAAFSRAVKVKNVDLVIGTSPPLFQAAAAAAASRVHGCAFLLEIRDLWPEFAVKMGAIKNPLIIKSAESLERYLYRACDMLVVNSPGFVGHMLARGAKEGMLRLVPNGVDTAMFNPKSTGGRWRAELSGGAKMLALYAGALGPANGIDTVLDAATILRDRPDIRIVLVGDGADKDRLAKRAAELSLGNVAFHPPVPKSEIPEVLAAADICVSTLAPLPVFATTYPNKIFDYLAAGRPTVSDIQGPIAKVIEDAGGGRVVPPGDSKALASAIAFYADNPGIGRSAGERAREHVEKHFDRRNQAVEFRSAIEEAHEFYTSWRSRRVGRFLKRALDILLSVLGLFVLLPVTAVIAALVALKLGRPVIFEQTRIGLAGEKFNMLKFRSMTDARDASGHPLSDELRLTDFGKLLRRWSLDELLQLINVLRGEMSLVGPRPLPEAYRPRYSRIQWRRHYVRPGITGWGQINGRNAVEWDARFAYDNWYARNWSVPFDLKIIFKTIGRVLQRSGISKPGMATMTEFRGSDHSADKARAAIFLSVRNKATRLPGKVLADIRGEPALVHLIKRLKTAKEADLLVVTTSVNPDDAELISLAKREGVEAFAGSEDDKLQRYLDAAREFSIDFAVVVDGDDIFVSVEHIDDAIRSYREAPVDFISQSGLPLGAASFGIRIETLAEIVATKDENDTEVWGDYFLKREGAKTRVIEEKDPLLNHPEVRMTLDYPEDLAFLRAIYERHSGNAEPTLREVMALVIAEPELAAINSGMMDVWRAKLATAAPVKFK